MEGEIWAEIWVLAPSSKKMTQDRPHGLRDSGFIWKRICVAQNLICKAEAPTRFQSDMLDRWSWLSLVSFHAILAYSLSTLPQGQTRGYGRITHIFATPPYSLEYPNVCLNTESDVTRTPTLTSSVYQLWRQSFAKRMTTLVCHSISSELWGKVWMLAL